MRWTPTKLISVLCAPEMAAGWKSEQREHSYFHAGHVPPSLYDDPAIFAIALLDSGWREPEDAGVQPNWPHAFILLWGDHESEAKHAIAHHWEGDLAVEIFDSEQELNRALVALLTVEHSEPENPDARPVTLYQLAVHRLRASGWLGDAPPICLSAGEFNRAGIAVLGDCEVCAATITAYNACPSRTGNRRCARGCIKDQGYTTAGEADTALFGTRP
jgi:hypothetical protein